MSLQLLICKILEKRKRNEAAWKKNRAKRAPYFGEDKLYNDKIKRFSSKINFV